MENKTKNNSYSEFDKASSEIADLQNEKNSINCVGNHAEKESQSTQIMVCVLHMAIMMMDKLFRQIRILQTKLISFQIATKKTLAAKYCYSLSGTYNIFCISYDMRQSSFFILQPIQQIYVEKYLEVHYYKSTSCC